MPASGGFLSFGDAYEVEFVLGSGRTQAVVTLRTSDLRGVGESELLAVREAKKEQAAYDKQLQEEGGGLSEKDDSPYPAA